MLVVDQFEEMFTAADNADADMEERDAFVEALHAAATKPVGPQATPRALIVVVVRGDFLDRAIIYPPLAASVQAGPFAVGPMREAGLREAITGPAAEAGLDAKPDLVDAVITELRKRAKGSLSSGALPLMSQAMAATWERREGNELTLRAYRRAGGIADSVNRSAEAAYKTLTSSQQAMARVVFTGLTIISQDGQLARRRCSRAELYSAQEEARDDLDVVIGVFSAQRLLVLSEDSIEISHDALLGAWSQLREWLGDDQLDGALYSQVITDADTWEAHRRDSAYLYRSTRLAAIDTASKRWADNPGRYPPLPLASAAFLRAAHRIERRSTRTRRAVICGLAVLTLTATTLAGIARHNATDASQQAADATRQGAIALSRQLAANSLSVDPNDPVTARQLAVAAWGVYPTSQAGSAMTTLLTEQQQNGELPAASSAAGVDGVAFSPDGKLLASASGDGYVQLWNPVTGAPAGKPLPVDPGNPNGVSGVAFNPDSKLLATADFNGYLRLWNPVTGAPVGRPLPADTGQDGDVRGVAFSPDGRLLASADANGYLRLWNPATGAPVGKPLPADPGGDNGVFAVAFSPDGRLLASADGDGYVRLWNPATGAPVGKPLPADPNSQYGVFAVAFSPDGRLLASADGDGQVRLWNPATGAPVGKPLPADPGPNGGVFGVAFSPDSRLLATADADGYVRLWNPANGTPLGQALPADPGQGLGVQGVAFSPDGKMLASADDSYTQLWNPLTGRAVGQPLPADPGQYGSVQGVAFSPDGRLLASADGDGYVRLWNPATGTPVGKPLPADPGQNGGVQGVAFSPGGRLLASADSDGYVRLWNPATGTPVGKPLPADHGNQYGVLGVAFSPDGRLLASADGDGYVRLWNPATGTPVGKPLPADPNATDGVFGVAFSPDGRLLASANGDGYVRLWNPATGAPVGKPLPADLGKFNGVLGVAFSPSGKLLASADDNGYVRLWNPATGAPVGKPLPVDPGQNQIVYEPDAFSSGPIRLTDAVTSGEVLRVAFSPDGSLLASADGDGYVRLWNPATGDQVGQPLSAGPSSQNSVWGVAFSPDSTLLASADGDGTIKTWPVSLFANPYTALCAEVGPPTKADWTEYGSGVQPNICADQSDTRFRSRLNTHGSGPAPTIREIA